MIDAGASALSSWLYGQMIFQQRCHNEWTARVKAAGGNVVDMRYLGRDPVPYPVTEGKTRIPPLERTKGKPPNR